LEHVAIDTDDFAREVEKIKASGVNPTSRIRGGQDS